MRLIFFLFIVLSTTVCLAQNDFLNKRDQEVINKFYLDIGIISGKSGLADSSLRFTEVVAIHKIKRKSSDGIYVLIPPVEPYREYVMLLDDSCRVLKSKDLEYDLPLVLSFLSKSKSPSLKQLVVLLDRLVKTYQGNSPPKGAPRRM